MSYETHTWESGETITAEKLNNLEDGVQEALDGGSGGSGDDTLNDLCIYSVLGIKYRNIRFRNAESVVLPVANPYKTVILYPDSMVAISSSDIVVIDSIATHGVSLQGWYVADDNTITVDIYNPTGVDRTVFAQDLVLFASVLSLQDIYSLCPPIDDGGGSGDSGIE